MSARRRAALAAALLAGAACYTSPPARSDPAVMDPHGVRGRLVMTNGQRVDAELLMIDDTIYVLETEGRIAIARYTDVKSAEFAQIGVMTIRSRRAPSARVIRAARARARFPYGISADVMTALLAGAHQVAPLDLGTSAPVAR